MLNGCPWVLPRPVFVLTSQQWGWKAVDGIQSTYTLRVKVVQEGAADAIAKVGCGLQQVAGSEPAAVRPQHGSLNVMTVVKANVHPLLLGGSVLCMLLSM